MDILKRLVIDGRHGQVEEMSKRPVVGDYYDSAVQIVRVDEAVGYCDDTDTADEDWMGMHAIARLTLTDGHKLYVAYPLF